MLIYEYLTNMHLSLIYSASRYMAGASEEVDISADVDQVIDYQPSYDDLTSER